MVGSELNPTQGKRGGKPGDIGASSFPSASHSKPALQALAGVFSRGFSLSFLVLCSETARKHLLRRLSHPPFFFLVNFSPALFNLKAWNNRLAQSLPLLAPDSVLSYLCQAPSDGVLPLLVPLFVFTGFCHILRLGSFVVSSSPIRITLECKQIVLFSSRQSPLLYVRSFFATLAIFHVTHHVTALDQ